MKPGTGRSGDWREGGSLFGLQHSNPVDTGVAYGGNSANNGMSNDFMVNRKIGRVNIFGDTSCADHMIGWRVRHNLALDYLTGVGGVAAIFSGDPGRPDNIVYDITANPGGGTGNSLKGFGHPTCLNTGAPAGLPAVQ